MEAKIIHKISYENLTMIIESMVAKQFKNSDQPVTVDEFTDYLWETPEKEYVLFEIGSQRKPETMPDQTIEQRISVLEKELAELKGQVSERPENTSSSLPSKEFLAQKDLKRKVRKVLELMELGGIELANEDGCLCFESNDGMTSVNYSEMIKAFTY